ncbi:MAG: RCC1-like domain-containing protein, partial [Phycisphaerales bacterium]
MRCAMDSHEPHRRRRRRSPLAAADADGRVHAWGRNDHGQCE